MSDTIPTDNNTSDTAQSDNMRVTISPTRAADLVHNLQSVHSRISAILSTKHNSSRPRLVAVSKLKPAADILSLHQPPTESSDTPAQPHLHFGENYVQELLSKSLLLPKSIRWHFIGGLQSNKCLQLARDVDSLWAVESVDSEKKASQLNKGRGERNKRLQESNARRENGEDSLEEGPLRVFIQVNTSGEASKSGVDPQGSALLDLAKFVNDACDNLTLQGLMTIGAIARSQATTAETENEDFICLREARDKLAEELGIRSDELELSMGMSEDFEGAIIQGSNEVRVGSTIFGERPPKNEAKVLESTHKN